MKLELNYPLLICLFGILISNCSKKEEYNFNGKWQSLNDKRIVIEFGADGNYFMFSEGNSILENVAEYGQLKFKVTEGKGNRNDFTIYNEDSKEVFTKGKIEIVNQDRIRVFHFKHHDILDVADEYYRTNDLNGFDEIMNGIMKVPEN
jgi:hypothetical protein